MLAQISGMRVTGADAAILAVVLFLLSLIHVWKRRTGKSRLPQPPGPRGLPLIGNLLDVPTSAAWVAYREMGRKLGSDLVRVSILGNNIIVVNSLEAASDLLEKRSANYSDRQQSTMLHELCGFTWGIAFRAYGKSWRDARTVLRLGFGQEPVKKYRDSSKRAAHELLRRLLHSPEMLMEHLRHMAGALIMDSTYGITVLPQGDPYVETAEHALSAASAAGNPGSYFVDVLPILKYIPEWFPGAAFQRQARLWRASVMKMAQAPWDVVVSCMDRARPCAARIVLDSPLYQNAPDPRYIGDVIRDALGSMYGGGADTTVSILGSFVLAMVLNPEIQQKAQLEIDDVCGRRFPALSDRPCLPYLDAILKEALRWHPVIPLIIPHRSISDDIYNGQFIPEGSIVVANAWAMLHDETVYPEPERFNPDRFMKDGKLNPDIRDPSTSVFGFGRRICPGRFLAYESLWINIAFILSVFNLSKVKDENGELITPREEYMEGMLCYPKPFRCEFQPRSDEHRARIMAAGIFVSDY